MGNDSGLRRKGAGAYKEIDARSILPRKKDSARGPARARDLGGRRRLAYAATARAWCRRLLLEHEPLLSTKDATTLLSLCIQSADERRILLRLMQDDGID